MVELLGDSIIDCSNPCDLNLNFCDGKDCSNVEIIVPEHDYCMLITKEYHIDIYQYDIAAQSMQKWLTLDNDKDFYTNISLGGKTKQDMTSWVISLPNCQDIEEQIEQDIKDSNKRKYLEIGLSIGAAIVFIVTGYIIYKKIKSCQENPDIDSEYAQIEGASNV